MTRVDNVDQKALQELFDDYDLDRDGSLTLKEVESMLVKLGVAPLVNMIKRNSAKETENSAKSLSDKEAV